MIVVTGATGQLGALVMDALLQNIPAAELTVVVRNPSRAADLATRGVQIGRADYDRPDRPAEAWTTRPTFSAG